MTGERIKLRAEDAEDLAVIASLLQDAILPLADMTYLEAEQRFVLVANRFRWEAPGVTARLPGQRVLSGIAFSGVTRCRLRRIDLKQRELLLDLLHLDVETRDAGFAITLLCAEDRAIRLEVERIDMLMADQGDPWPTPSRPQHDEKRKKR